MENDLIDMDNTHACIRIVGIGNIGIEAINFFHQQNYFDDIPGISYSVISEKSECIANSVAEHKILINDPQINIIDNNLDIELLTTNLCQLIGHEFEDKDAFFILTDFNEPENVILGSILTNILMDRGLSNHGFIVAIINQPGLLEEKKLHDCYIQGKQAILDTCDTVIVNSPKEFFANFRDEKQGLDNTFNYELSAMYQSLRIFIYSICSHGLIGFDFADAKTLVSGNKQGIVISGKSSEVNRAVLATQYALNKLERIWGDLLTSKIDSVLVDFSIMDMEIAELNEALNVIHNSFLNTIVLKQTITYDDTLNDNLVVNIFATKI